MLGVIQSLDGDMTTHPGEDTNSDGEMGKGESGPSHLRQGGERGAGAGGGGGGGGVGIVWVGGL